MNHDKAARGWIEDIFRRVNHSKPFCEEWDGLVNEALAKLKELYGGVPADLEAAVRKAWKSIDDRGQLDINYNQASDFDPVVVNRITAAVATLLVKRDKRIKELEKELATIKDLCLERGWLDIRCDGCRQPLDREGEQHTFQTDPDDPQTEHPCGKGVLVEVTEPPDED